MKSIKKAILLMLIVGTLIAGTAHYYLSLPTQKIVYTTETVRAGNIEKQVLTNGVLYPYKMVNVGAQVSGKLETIAAKVGNTIKQGELIAQIDNLAQKNALKEAKASLTNINAQYRAKKAQIYQSQLAFDRQKKMLATNASSQSNFDSAEAELLVYQAELEQLVAEKEKALISVDDAKLDLGYTSITSPIDGTVVYVSVEEGQTVNTNQSTPSIAEIAQLDVMTIKAQVSEADIIHIYPGQKAYFSILGAPNKHFYGKIRSIDPGPTLMTGDDSELNIDDNDAIYYNVLFEVNNQEQILRIGMTAQVSIILDEADNVLLIPSQVLTNASKDGAYQVSVLVDEQVEVRTVKIGLNNRVQAEVVSGLAQGEQVIMGQANLAQKSAARMPDALTGRIKGQSGKGGGR